MEPTKAAAHEGHHTVSMTLLGEKMNFYVYFIQEEKASAHAPVKIGFSCDVQSRIETMQIGNPRKLVLRFSLGPMSQAEAMAYEARLHRMFKTCRLRGEWFSGKILKRLAEASNAQSTPRRERTKSRIRGWETEAIPL